MKSYIRFVLNHPKTIFFLTLLITAASALPLKDMGQNNSINIWADPDHPNFVKYNEFKNLFGNDISIAIAYKTDTLFTKEQLIINRKLTEKLQKIENIENISSLTNMKSVRLKNYKIISTRIINENTRYMESQKKRAVSDSLLVDNVLSEDGASTALWLELKQVNDTINLKTLDEVKKVLEDPEFEGMHFYLIGGITLLSELNRISNMESGRFVIICVIFMAILLRLMLHTFSMALLPILIAGLSAMWAMGLYAIHNDVNMVSGVMPLIIMVIGIANAVHMVSHFRSWYGPNRSIYEATAYAMEELIIPCLFTNLTTAVAFLAFLSSDLPPLRTLGLYTASGIFITYLLSFVLLPALLVSLGTFLFKKSHREKEKETHPFLIHLPIWVAKHKTPIIIVSLGIMIFSIFGARKIEFETDQIRYLKKDNTVRHATDVVTEWFKGVYPIEIVLQANEKNYFHKIWNLRKIEKIEDEIAKLERVKRMFSPTTFINSFKDRLVAQAGIKLTPEQEQKGFKKLLSMKIQPIPHFISEDGDRLRISIRSSWLDNNQMEELTNKIRAIVDPHMKELNLTYFITGYAYLYSDINQFLIRSQSSSIAISFFLIFFMILIMSRRFWLSVLAMIPNVLPVLTTLGIIGWLGVKLDVATVLIAAISLGIAIDDTIHLIYAFIDHQREGKDVPDALSIAMRHVGSPIMVTTAVLIGGFGVMMTSNFLPIFYFGSFVAINVLLALLYDMLLLPAVISFVHLTKNKVSA